MRVKSLFPLDRPSQDLTISVYPSSLLTPFLSDDNGDDRSLTESTGTTKEQLDHLWQHHPAAAALDE